MVAGLAALADLPTCRPSGRTLIDVPDPVACAVDPQGRVYVSATTRRKVGDLDIREHTMWIPDDVGFTSVGVALRRQRSEAVAEFLGDRDVLVLQEAARAIHDDLGIPGALPALVARLDAAPASEPFTRRAINASLRVGTPDTAARRGPRFGR
ncbi:MAG: hypothetical protein Q7S40_22755 [Opitutaceae bacterium]|nr:hypothetical protein [Opitutaceae bacterium]